MAATEHINPNTFKRKKPVEINELIPRLLDGDITALSQAITIVESTSPKHALAAQSLIAETLKYSGKSMRLGITGVPGVGKSTFIEALGTSLLTESYKVAVLAIDPSSGLSRGSILGDKTRMEELVKDKNAFIRPSPAGETLGGVARKTREAIVLCEAAGFNFIIVETVGVGQSETAVHSMTDFFLLLKLAGAGDDLQGIKRGIMEMADAIVINKADGDNLVRAKHARREFSNAVHLMSPKTHGRKTKVLTSSGLNATGIQTVKDELLDFFNFAQTSGYLKEKRKNQDLYWLKQTIDDEIRRRFYNHPEMEQTLKEVEKKVMSKELSPFKAAEILLDQFKTS